MKVVLDTNIYLSGLIFPGSKPAKILNSPKANKFTVFCCPLILNEIRKNLLVKFHRDDFFIESVIGDILKYSIIINPPKYLHVIKAKQTDNQILDCAVAAKADYLVSGDRKHILSLKEVESTKIISAAKFLEIIFLS